MNKTNNTQLIEFLNSQNRPEGTLNYHQLQGFLFAICCSPELIKPSDWLPFIFDEQDANYVSIEQAQSITQALMALYNEINQELIEAEVKLPDDILIKETAMDNVGEDAPVGQWSSGFSMGHNWLVELWDHYIPDSLEQELSSCLMILSLFSSRKLAQAFASASQKSLDEYVAMAQSMFDGAMHIYAHIAYSIQSALAQQAQSQQPVVHDDKVGRNDPCPCGSGKKYKKCCLH
ncbi:MAG: UPF0149 family protein [Gammaproteobacteria bacterium]